jgi:hypothetical protein
LCVSVCVPEEKIEGHGRYFKKFIYIYIYKWVCVVRKQKKKKQICFFKENEAFGQERKNKFKLGNFSI